MKKSNLNKIKEELTFVYSGNQAISIVFNNNNLLMGVVGELNSNLKELEKLSGSSIYFRGNSIVIKGIQEKNELVKKAIVFLTEQFKINGSVEKKDIISSLDKFMINEQNNKRFQNLDYIIKTPKRSVIPRSKKTTLPASLPLSISLGILPKPFFPFSEVQLNLKGSSDLLIIG